MLNRVEIIALHMLVMKAHNIPQGDVSSSCKDLFMFSVKALARFFGRRMFCTLLLNIYFYWSQMCGAAFARLRPPDSGLTFASGVRVIACSRSESEYS